MGKIKTGNRLGEENLNHQGCLMKIIEYNRVDDIVVEFQDEHKGRIHTQYQSFIRGNVKNPYYPMVLSVGMIGSKYPAKINNKETEEYQAWKGMIYRCFDEKTKEKQPTYKNVSCCKDWLLFENFYEWLHSQENFENLYNQTKWNVDKDIIIKGNKVYSPDTCCLVPNNVNSLFIKKDNYRGDLPIGVKKSHKSFMARCSNPITENREYLGSYSTPYYAFLAYKKRKEEIIKDVAQMEYNKGNISKQCYESMMMYKVEIDD